MKAKNANSMVGNHLLKKLPAAELKRIVPKLSRVRLNIRDSLYSSNEPIRMVYFPEDCVVSLVSNMKQGQTVEVGTVGKEGMVGIPIMLGATSTPLDVFAQVPGNALKMSVSDFKDELKNGGQLRLALNRYTQALFTQLSQSVGCNRLHSVEKRCARWLLLTSDRVGRRQFNLTQEFLAQMLGIRRASVNVVLKKFQRAGMISYKNGEINIQEPKRIEARSCECYRITRNEYEKLTGSP